MLGKEAPLADFILVAEVHLIIHPPILEVTLVRHVDGVLELVPVLYIFNLPAGLEFREFHREVLAIAVPVSIVLLLLFMLRDIKLSYRLYHYNVSNGCSQCFCHALYDSIKVQVTIVLTYGLSSVQLLC